MNACLASNWPLSPSTAPQLNAKKKYEDKKDFETKLAKALEKKTDHESELAEAERDQETLLVQVSEIKARLADAEATLKQAQETELEKDDIVKEARNILKDAEGDHGRVTKTMNAEESDLMVLRQKLHETLQKARVDEVELPVLVDSGEVDDDMDADDEDAQRDVF